VFQKMESPLLQAFHFVSISANRLRKNKQGSMYRRKPWQQGITPANQGRHLRSPGVMPSCYGFLLHKNHMVGITENALPVLLAVVPAVHF
jgi:hypothetical protein